MQHHASDAVIRLTRGADAPWSTHRSGMAIQFGVSAAQSGSTHVFMTRQRIPPGMRSTPHVHVNCETAMYVLRGPVVMRSGPGLAQEQVAQTGDFFFIPADAPHQIVNPGATADVEVVLCRNAADEIVREIAVE